MENETKDSKQSIQPNELIDFYWNYYQLHAEQRLKILEFFVTVEIVLIGGFISTLQEYPHIAMMAGFLSSVVSLLCYWLDKRTTNLLHECRIAIRKFEEEYMNCYASEYKLFSNVKNNEGFFNYSKVIRGTYGLIFMMGLIFIIVA